MWALTEAGVAKARKLAGQHPESEDTPEQDTPESEDTPERDTPESEDTPKRESQTPPIDLESPYTAEELRKGASDVKRIWSRLVDIAGLQGKMEPPIIELMTRKRNWGFWNAKKRILAIHARLAVRFSGTLYLQGTVAHELAHQSIARRKEKLFQAVRLSCVNNGEG